ncbi:hypothetical protein K439DRAFT_668298 [Ramaria rubella]|nr:hypothetical protein K439DRAFT_668298 [Ramaria rubella]
MHRTPYSTRLPLPLHLQLPVTWIWAANWRAPVSRFAAQSTLHSHLPNVTQHLRTSLLALSIFQDTIKRTFEASYVLLHVKPRSRMAYICYTLLPACRFPDCPCNLS